MHLLSLITAARTIARCGVLLLIVPFMAQAQPMASDATEPESEVLVVPATPELPATDASQPAEADVSAEAEVEDPVLAAERQVRLLRAQALQDRINDLSVASGPFDPSLIELQDDLGRTYLELEEFELAHGVLEQAMQLVRVNDGLYSERQVELLDALVDANIGLKEWEQVDIYSDLLFDLQARMHAKDSVAYADALMKVGAWRLQALRYNLLYRAGSPQAVQTLHDLHEQQELILGHARERNDVGQQWSLLKSIAATEMEMARQFNYQSMSGFQLHEPQYVSQTVCRTVPTASGGFQRVCWQERVSNPDYLYSAASQRRNQAERTRMGLQATAREMEALLAENPDFAEANAEETRLAMQSVDEALKQLRRDTRRSSLPRW
ncbi:hypothetical protein PHACT_06460 [Pseudohongiella acticola]|uniref:Uncharacterized protein n=1 Tax=Pseudohongiella acticola TaxID=1524254 RepID=A0A1E8CK95_9GAMM|nr:hypothetical protein [Pseudohongiella acticola]OFE12824.1 hypothetical protein PHACT_06460 [Pseudohongiella acticola]